MPVTDWATLDLYSSIAQSVEHLTVNQGVTGSSPVGGVKKSLTDSFCEVFSCFNMADLHAGYCWFKSSRHRREE